MTEARLQLQRVAGIEIVTSRTARRVLAVFVFALLTTLGAYAAVPMKPVPVTLQTLFVTLSGVLLGPTLGAASMLVYLAAGASGLPVFTPTPDVTFLHLLGPTGGYLLAFPPAAFLAGWLTAPSRLGAPAESLKGAARMALAIFAATLVIFAGGVAQLNALYLHDIGRAFQVGVVPFIPGDIVKVLLAVLIARRIQKRSLELL
jgi:biotin transport system substrate-specific component